MYALIVTDGQSMNTYVSKGLVDDSESRLTAGQLKHAAIAVQ